MLLLPSILQEGEVDEAAKKNGTGNDTDQNDAFLCRSQAAGFRSARARRRESSVCGFPARIAIRTFPAYRPRNARRFWTLILVSSLSAKSVEFVSFIRVTDCRRECRMRDRSVPSRQTPQKIR